MLFDNDTRMNTNISIKMRKYVLRKIMCLEDL